MQPTWNDIARSLKSLAKVDGGFNSAHRGVVTLPSNKQVFVKVGIDEHTKLWANKEISAYKFLAKHDYVFIPKLIAYNNDATRFALEALLPEDGWDWSDTWTEARLAKTLEAMDALAVIVPTGEDREYYGHPTVNEDDDGWRQLATNPELQQTLRNKFRSAGYENLADTLDFTVEATRSSTFTFQTDKLVHNDVRADNCAWNDKLQTVKLVDWNWMQLGDRRIDLSATLVSVHKNGLDVLANHRDRLDADALHWLAGFWLKSAATPIWPGGPEHLRDSQLQSGVTALGLAEKLVQ